MWTLITDNAELIKTIGATGLIMTLILWACIKLFGHLAKKDAEDLKLEQFLQETTEEPTPDPYQILLHSFSQKIETLDQYTDALHRLKDELHIKDTNLDYYNRAAKYLTYAREALNQIHRDLNQDKLNTFIMQGIQTGEFSYKSPQLQTIPRTLQGGILDEYPAPIQWEGVRPEQPETPANISIQGHDEAFSPDKGTHLLIEKQDGQFTITQLPDSAPHFTDKYIK